MGEKKKIPLKKHDRLLLQRDSQNRRIACHRQECSAETVLPFTAQGIFPFHRNCTRQSWEQLCQWLCEFVNRAVNI